MVIQKAVVQDLQEILALYELGRRKMRESGNLVQWQGGYPDEELLREDIRNGHLFKVTDGEKIRAVFALVKGPEKDYYSVKGKWLSEDPYMVIHRFVSAGGGMAALVFSWALEQTASLRIDTHADNAAMRRVLEREGFTYVGDVTLADGSPRRAYHKIRKQKETGTS